MRIRATLGLRIVVGIWAFMPYRCRKTSLSSRDSLRKSKDFLIKHVNKAQNFILSGQISLSSRDSDSFKLI